MVHLTETCDAAAPRLLLHADKTPANVHEARRTEPIFAALVAKGLPPAEHLVDAAYVSAEHLVTARRRHGIARKTLCTNDGPVRKDRQSGPFDTLTGTP